MESEGRNGTAAAAAAERRVGVGRGGGVSRSCMTRSQTRASELQRKVVEQPYTPTHAAYSCILCMIPPPTHTHMFRWKSCWGRCGGWRRSWRAAGAARKSWSGTSMTRALMRWRRCGSWSRCVVPLCSRGSCVFAFGGRWGQGVHAAGLERLAPPPTQAHAQIEALAREKALAERQRDEAQERADEAQVGGPAGGGGRMMLPSC